jgi:hypothetical protein
MVISILGFVKRRIGRGETVFFFRAPSYAMAPARPAEPA